MDDQLGTQFAAMEVAPAFEDPYLKPATRPPIPVSWPSPSVERSLLRAINKRLLDVSGALLLAFVFSPMLLFVSLAMCRDGGDVLFRHIRIGRNGKVFRVYKFRTMVKDADQILPALLAANADLREEWLRDHKLKNDPRVTSVGKFLRSTSLDELPQLWNVLKGEMSLVGPRPVTGEELSRYGRASRFYLALKPGITGFWQISGRNNIPYCRRVAMDRRYAKTASLFTDLTILGRTVMVVLQRKGA